MAYSSSVYSHLIVSFSPPALHRHPGLTITLPGSSTDLAKEMLKYEKARFGAWCSTVDSAVTEGLQQPLLAWQAEQAPDSCLSGPAATEPSGGAPASQHGEGSSGRGAPRQAAINFPPALLRLMREAKYLSQLGLSVPPLAVNLALQEGQIRCAGHA